MIDLSNLANDLKPYLARWIRGDAQSGVGIVLSSSQYPEALLRDGSRSLLGHLVVGPGITIDGVDISAFAAHQIVAGDGLSGGGVLGSGNVSISVNTAHAFNWSGLHTFVGGVTISTGQLTVNAGAAFNGLATFVGGVTISTGQLTVNAGAAFNGLATFVGGVTISTGQLTVNAGAAFNGLATFVGGVTISTGQLTVNSTSIFNSLITVNAGANVAVNQAISSSNFVSGFAGAGWRVDHGITSAGRASAEMDDLIVRGVMRVYELIIHKIRAGNGSYLFAPGGRVTSVSGSGPYTIDFETDHGFAANDLIRAQKFDLGFGGVYQSNMTVTSVPSTTQIIATLNSGVAPQRGFEYARIGNTSDTNRQGGVYVTSDDSNAPYIDVFDGVTSHSEWQSAVKTRVRIGRLTGWGSHYPSTAYGFVTGTVNGLWLGVDAANGIRIMNNTTQIARWDTAGNITIGEVAPNRANTFISAGEIHFRSHTTSYFRIASDGRVVLAQGNAATSSINWETTGGSLVAQTYGFRTGAISYLSLVAYGYSTTSGVAEMVAFNVNNTGQSALRVLGYEQRIEATRTIHISDAGGGLSIGASFAAPPSGGIQTSGNIVVGGWMSVGSTSPPNQALKVAGNVEATGYIAAVGAVYASNWLRTYGNTGWYSETHGGGIWMSDSTWIRTYGAKNFYCDQVIRAESGLVGGNLSGPPAACKWVAGRSDSGHAAQVAINITTNMGTGWQQITNSGVMYRCRVLGLLVIPGVGAWEINALVVSNVDVLVFELNAGSGTLYRLWMTSNSNGVYVRSEHANFAGTFSALLVNA